MNRRIFLLAPLAGVVSPSTFAWEASHGTPFDRVGPFAQDAKSVYEFFMFSCHYCQQHHESVASWGGTIPKPVVFESVPVVIDFESFNAARSYYAVRRAAPNRLSAYTRAVFDAARRGSVNPASDDVLATAGVGREVFQSAWKHPSVKDSIERAITLAERYKVKVTPTLTIGGTTAMHADHVNGDYGLLMRLASGFVSRLLEG